MAAQVTLFIGNLTQEWQDEQTLHTELSKHGHLERLFVAKTADGSHKVTCAPLPSVCTQAMRKSKALRCARHPRVPPWPCVCKAQGVLHSCHYSGLLLLQKYAIAEFDIPYSASRAKKALDQIENSMKPDQNKRGGGSTAQVKLLRSEFAAIKSVQSQFSKILFVSNLPPVCLLPGLLAPPAPTSMA